MFFVEGEALGWGEFLFLAGGVVFEDGGVVVEEEGDFGGLGVLGEEELLGTGLGLCEEFLKFSEGVAIAVGEGPGGLR